MIASVNKNIFDDFYKDNKDSFINDICELIKIDSQKTDSKPDAPFGDGPKAALIKAAELAENFGFKVTNYDNYVIAIDFNDKEKNLDILAHLDVVPGGDGWTVTKPFSPIVKGSFIYGRGSSDNKGPAIASLYAMKALKELNLPLTKNVRLILGSDEECGSSDLKYYYSIENEAPFSFTPDADFPIINTEKGRVHGRFSKKISLSKSSLISLSSGLRSNVVPPIAKATLIDCDINKINAYIEKTEKLTEINFKINKSNNALEITSTGTNAHCASPWDGNNALTGMLTLLSMVLEENDSFYDTIHFFSKYFPHNDYYAKALSIDGTDEISGPTTVNLGILNISEDKIEGEFDIRCCINSTKENTSDILVNLFKKNNFILDAPFNPPHHVDSDSLLIKELLSCYELYTGNKGKTLSTGGGTYVHDLKRGVAFGCTMPGENTHMHGPDEFANIDNLILSSKIFAAAIVRLCS